MNQNKFVSLDDGYVWCLGCNRAYKKDELKWDEWSENYVCKHDDCHYRMTQSFRPYDQWRDVFGWPQNPVEGEKYRIT